MRAYPIVLVALALLAGTAGYVTHRATAPSAPPPAVLAPAAGAETAPPGPLDWTFDDLEGRQRRLGEWPGKAVVVNFWATWCPPCLREIPAFIALQERLGAEGLQFIGVALDEPEAVAPFVADKGVNYPVLVGEDRVMRLMQLLGNDVGGLPYTVVLAADGSVSYRHQGEWHADAAAEFLEGILKPR